ncbi:DUF695 domain-containing protein [Pseudomonas sp. ABC1]|uniref:DUF695 domain-containing protein n=1 Tax=Pseudomonas sp. ABC1 TaxID=2748080 RepID=UPI0015C37845|nr:DUF695 domain-containing protein [Pseudomonas sp. ABC1]QLF93448.1 DUF695 domain-containing protein [Pseudomonas sp. ABC1]
MAQAEYTWSVATGQANGNPLVFKFINETPTPDIRQQMPWLTVVSWKYDGSENGGMPSDAVNASLIQLEDHLEKIEGEGTLYLPVYSVTGNNLKEFVFHIADRERFMENFNQALQGQPVYPIGINFYEDKEWSELAKLHKGVAAGSH